MIAKAAQGSLLAAIAMFAWGFITWGILADKFGVIRELPDEEPIRAAVTESVTEDGTYVVPLVGAWSEEEGAREAWSQRHAEGPVGVLFLRPAGIEPAPGKIMFLGFLCMLLACVVAATLLGIAAPALASFGQRLAFVSFLGAFASVAIHLPNAVWWYYPARFTIWSIVVTVTNWLIAGAILSAFVKHRR